MPPAPTLPALETPGRQPPELGKPCPRARPEPMDTPKRGIAEPVSCRSPRPHPPELPKPWKPEPMAAGADGSRIRWKPEPMAAGAGEPVSR
jgi:hypothetical protein